MDENKTTNVQDETVTKETAATQTVCVKERLKSWAVWTSVLGALAVILNAFGVFEKIGINSTTFDAIVNSIGSVLIAFGILNNPTDKTHF